MRKRCTAAAAATCLLGVVCVCAMTGARAAPAAPTEPPQPVRNQTPGSAAAGRPALWRTYDMIINFHNLSRTYTCNQLWSAFHGILLRLGAWPYGINILPYQCSPAPNGDMKSPNVEVRFQMPIFLQGVAVKSAPAQAIEGTIRLAPGEPKTLQDSDCQLLQQIDQTMLASMPVRIDAEHFDCAAAPPRAEKFSVTVSLPMGVNMPAVATTSAPAPH